MINKWVKIPGFSKYEANQSGEIRNTNFNNTGTYKIVSENFDKDGYLKIWVKSDEGLEKTISKHRLIALTFIPNPNNYPMINHRNGIKDDNRVENLEWCTNSMNQLHSFRVLGNTPHNKGKLGKDVGNNIPVFQYSMEGFFVKGWDCAADVMRELGIDGSAIAKVVSGKYQQTGGFIWKSEYLGEKIEVIIKAPIRHSGKKNVASKAIYQLSEFETIEAKFENAFDVNRKLGYNRRGICDACNTGKFYKGSYWIYESEYNLFSEYYNY